MTCWEESYRIYHELIRAAPVSMAGRPWIPFSELAAYAAVEGYTRDETSRLWQKVHCVDRVFHEEYAKADKARTEGQKK